MIFAAIINKIPEFYMIIAGKMFLSEFWGHVGTFPSRCPVSCAHVGGPVVQVVDSYTQVGTRQSLLSVCGPCM